MNDADRTCVLVVIVRLLGDLEYLRQRIGQLKKHYSIPFLQDLNNALETLSQDLERVIQMKRNEEHDIPTSPILIKESDDGPAVINPKYR